MPKDLYVSQTMEGLEKVCKVPELFRQKPAHT